MFSLNSVTKIVTIKMLFEPATSCVGDQSVTQSSENTATEDLTGKDL